MAHHATGVELGAAPGAAAWGEGPIRRGGEALSLAAGSTTWDALLWVGVLLVVTIVGGFVVLAIRKQQFTRDATPGAEGAIESLRRMRDEGQITAEEYERARSKMVARVRDALARERSEKSASDTPRARGERGGRLPPSSG